MKHHNEYHTYTPEKVAKLKRLTAGLSRAEGVKRLQKALNISDRNARRQYAKYIENETTDKIAFEKAVAEVKKEVRPVVNIAGRKLRRLFWDIETSPNIGMFWKAGFKLNIGPESILKERAIICIGYKWEGESVSHVLHWDKNQCDKAMLIEFLKIANQADELVAHNGDGFDMPWFKTRCLYHGLQSMPDYKTVDTLQWARRKFYFNSNKLDYIAKFLGIGGKIHTGYDLWKDIVLKNCPIAMEKMLTYCRQDVVLLEEVWERLSKVVPHKSHAGVLAGDPKWTSPVNGNTNVKVSKTRVTAGGNIQYQMQDLDNGVYYTISSVAHAAYLEAKSGNS